MIRFQRPPRSPAGCKSLLSAHRPLESLTEPDRQARSTRRVVPASQVFRNWQVFGDWRIPLDGRRLVRWGVALFLVAVASGGTETLAQSIPWPNAPENGAVPAPDVGFFATQLSVLEATLTTYTGQIQNLARDLLILLIAIELAVSGATWGLSRTGIDELIYRLALKILVWGVLLKVIADTGSPSGILNMQNIPNGFRGMAFSLFGSPTGWGTNVYPGDLLEMGLIEAARIMGAGLLAGWWFAGVIGWIAAAAAVVTFAAFALLAVRLWIAIIHTIVAALIGLILLGFAGWRGTASFADRYIVWVFHASLFLFFMDTLLYLGGPIVSAMFQAAIDGSFLDTLLGLLMWPVIALTYLGMALYIPKHAARVITEGASTGLTRAISA